MIKIGIILSASAVGLLLAGPLGSRAGLWPFVVGFLMIGLALLFGLGGASLSLAGGVRHGSWAQAVAGIVLGLGAVSVPSAVILSALGKPPIHDITTDPDNPPAFVAALPLRAGAANPSEYGGADIARQQRSAYPDIQPLTLPVEPGAAFDRVLAAVEGLGWEVVARDRAAGRIEAVDTTFWFGFKDDVVVRVTAGDGGARIDVRSTSRVGVGDVGTNARRIRQLLLAVGTRP